MHLRYRNVNNAFKGIVSLIHNGDAPLQVVPSRAGEVIMLTEPVTTTYDRPQERVLINRNRDCNPFFHLYESLWMLAGRRDVAPLEYYNSKIGDIASDDGKTFHGAYGFRWREWFGYDQLKTIANHLTINPSSRREVLSMWGADAIGGDSRYGRHDLYVGSVGGKDVPCNTHAYFLVRTVGENNFLDMTVCNRSNDLIWGMLGANVVHFSFLQEYLAARIGTKVGKYHQFTNNLHVYTERWNPNHWLAEYSRDMYSMPVVEYDRVAHVPLVVDPDTFDNECVEFVERHQKDAMCGNYTELFLQHVAQPAMIAYHHYKRRMFLEAIESAKVILAKDWQIACVDWLKQRQIRKEERDAKTRQQQS